jgi:hypothetical protein
MFHSQTSVFHECTTEISAEKIHSNETTNEKRTNEKESRGKTVQTAIPNMPFFSTGVTLQGTNWGV